MVAEDVALVEFLRELKRRDYAFVAVTPATHARVVARPLRGKASLRDIFGWNRCFTERDLKTDLLELLGKAGHIEHRRGQLRSCIRVASLDGQLFAHSAYPTASADAVFFGPDTYRFSRFVRAHLRTIGTPEWIIDMGAGSGAGGIIAATLEPSARLTLVDINPQAARFARVNARSAAVQSEIALSDRIPPGGDLIIANPPYLIDTSHRTYRDGGGKLGGDVAYQWASQALDALVPGGTMLLYTGAAVVGGRAPVVEDIQNLCREARASLEVEEIDPDVFGEELETSDYGQIERIAAVGIRIKKSA